MTTAAPTEPSTSLHLVLHVHGELDLATAPALRQRIWEAVAAADGAGHRPVRIGVDLSGITFMDCSGLRPLIEAQAGLGNRLWLQNLSGPAARLVRLAELDGHFRLRVASLGEADVRSVGEADVRTVGDAGAVPPPLDVLRKQAADIERAAAGRALVERAKGLMMAALGVDARLAGQLLARGSDSAGPSQLELAGALVRASRRPPVRAGASSAQPEPSADSQACRDQATAER